MSINNRQRNRRRRRNRWSGQPIQPPRERLAVEGLPLWERSLFDHTVDKMSQWSNPKEEMGLYTGRPFTTGDYRE